MLFIFSILTEIILLLLCQYCAIYCVFVGVGCGTIVSLGDSNSNSSWLCSDTKEPGWTTTSFNDSLWEPATVNDTIQTPWDEFSANASWIWTSSDSPTAYCRFTRFGGGTLPERGVYIVWTVCRTPIIYCVNVRINVCRLLCPCNSWRYRTLTTYVHYTYVLLAKHTWGPYISKFYDVQLIPG